jgi:hypothetical protein
MSQLLVPRRFRGPASSGNGGWTAGALAALVDHDPDRPGTSVSLRRPPPLDTPMPVTATDGVTEASHDGEVVARAEPTDAAPALVEWVRADVARAAEASYPGLTSHPFPSCFSCGVGRAEGDGLRIFPGPVEPQDGATRVAATWTPHPSVAEHLLPTTWAALDCVGAWAGDLGERLMVLARMTAWIDALPELGEEHVVVGLARGQEDRKTYTGSALYDADGRVVGRAEHLWVAVDPADFA